MIQALALLKTAVLLLTLVASTPSLPQTVKDEAIATANNAITFANIEIAKSHEPITGTGQYTQVVNTPVQPAPTGTIPVDIQPLVTTQTIKKMTTIEIINPADGKGLGRNYVAYDWDEFNKPGVADSERPVGFKFPTEENYIYIGAVCKDESGSPVRDAQVQIVATDTTQNKTLNGSGSTTDVLDNLGQKSKVIFYPFTYQFKTSGDHTITFTCNGVSQAVTVTVSDPQ